MYPALNPSMIDVELPFEEAARLGAEAGFKGFAVDIEMAAREPDAVRRVLEVNKLVPAAWGLPVEFRGDEATFEEGLARFPALAKAAKLVGAPRCCTYAVPFSDEVPYEENFRLHRDRLRACAEVLAEHDCRLGIEYVGPKTFWGGHKYEFIHNQEQMLELIEAIGTGNVGLLIDVFHWYTSHGTLEDIRKLSDALVVDTHINDGIEGRGPDEQIDQDRRLPGKTGVFDLVGWLQALDAIGYTGPVTPEPFSYRLRELPPEEAIRASGEALLGVWKEAGV